MEALPDEIKNFLAGNVVATICFADKNAKPYCVSCFFVFDLHHRALLMKSSYGTLHEGFIHAGTNVSGTILPENIDRKRIRGIQFTGKILPAEEINGLAMNTIYLEAYPSTVDLPGFVWAIRPEYIKFTDNNMGVVSKTIWRAFSGAEPLPGRKARRS